MLTVHVIGKASGQQSLLGAIFWGSQKLPMDFSTV